MKNFVEKILAIIFVSVLFCCKDKGDPQPESLHGKSVGSSSKQLESTRMQVSILTDDENQVVRFHWMLVKTIVIKNNQSQSLKSPFPVGEHQNFDISLEIHDNCCSELIPLKVSFLNLGNIDIKSISNHYLKSQAFNKNKIYTGPPTGDFWPNQLYAGTVIACKTADGKFSLLKIKNVKFKQSIEVEIYQGAN